MRPFPLTRLPVAFPVALFPSKARLTVALFPSKARLPVAFHLVKQVFMLIDHAKAENAVHGDDKFG